MFLISLLRCLLTASSLAFSPALILAGCDSSNNDGEETQPSPRKELSYTEHCQKICEKRPYLCKAENREDANFDCVKSCADERQGDLNDVVKAAPERKAC